MAGLNSRGSIPESTDSASFGPIPLTAINFSNMALSGLTANGFVVDGGNSGAGDPKINIDRSTFTNIGGMQTTPAAT